MATEGMLARTWRKTIETYHIFAEIDVEQRAAAFAYYAVFSLIPLITLLLSVGSVFFSADDVKHLVQEFIPLGIQGQEEIWKWVSELQKARGGVSLISLVILSWSSMKFFQALVRAVNRAWHTEEIPWWQMPMKNLLMLGVIASGLALGIVIPAIMQGVTKALTALEHFLVLHIPSLQLAPLFAILDFSRYFVGGIVLLYTIALLYRVAPRRKVSMRDVWLPALIVTVALQVCQIAFVNYLPHFVNYNAIYGAIGLLMLLLIWVYLSGMLIITGACLCAAGRRSEVTRPSVPAV